MGKMSRHETQYYLNRLRLLFSINRTSTLIGVTYPTLVRWIDGDTLPSTKYRDKFKAALEELYDVIENEFPDPFATDLIDFLTEEDVPEQDAAIAHRPQVKRDLLRRLILDYLGDGKAHRSTQLLKQAEQEGFSRIATQQVATTMGVIKEKQGFGSGSYSIWRLPIATPRRR